jgi:hypothetical protein
MTNSAPFPGEPTLQELASPKHGIFIKLEGGHVRGMIPSFYVEHLQPGDLVVKVNGEPLLSPDRIKGKPFVVAQVPIERRWAISHNGEVMGELEFRKHYIMWYDEYFRELARENPDLENVDGGKADYDIPDPIRFVSVQVDETNPRQFVPANYDPHGTAGARSKQFFTSEGEEIDEDRLQVLCNAYADPKLRKRLKSSELEEVERSLGIPSSGGGSDIASKLELLNSMLEAHDLTTEQHSKQVALLTGADIPVQKPTSETEKHDSMRTQEPGDAATAESVTELNPGEPPTHTASARCGKQFTKPTHRGALGSVRFHQQKCPACKEASD